MREVRYDQSQSLFFVQVGALIAVGGLVYACVEEAWILGSISVVLGALVAQQGRQRLQERDVLLRLTRDRVWTKELGWRRWDEVDVRVQRFKQNGQDTDYGRLEISLPSDANRRFLGYVSGLDISWTELLIWLHRAGVIPH